MHHWGFLSIFSIYLGTEYSQNQYSVTTTGTTSRTNMTLILDIFPFTLSDGYRTQKLYIILQVFKDLSVYVYTVIAYSKAVDSLALLLIFHNSHQIEPLQSLSR